MTSLLSQPGLRAIVFANAESDREAVALDRPDFLMPLIDKTLIQHSIERAVQLGAGQIDIVVPGHLESVREITNGGKRWGVNVLVHLPVTSTQTFSIIRSILGSNPHQDAQLLIMHADMLCPSVRPRLASSAAGPTVCVAQGEWTGLALLNQKDAIQNYSLNTSKKNFAQALIEQAQLTGEIIECPQILSFRSGESFLDSQNRTLNGEFPELLAHLPTAERGVWIGRNTRIHPTARITSPVYIGANCEIGKGVTLGPGAVVEDDCLIDENVTVRNCIVLSSSSVGEGLDLTDTFMCGRKVLNTRINASIDICDAVLASDLRSVSILKLFSGLVSRATACLLLPIWLPILCILTVVSFATGRIRKTPENFVRTPTVENQYLWKSARLIGFRLTRPARTGRQQLWWDLLTRIIPGLPSVALGHLRLIGVSPRTSNELAELPKPWRDMLLAAQSGLISESLIQFGPNASTDPRSVADLWHSSSPRRLVRAILLGRYIRSLILGPQQKICGAPLRTSDSFRSIATQPSERMAKLRDPESEPMEAS